MKTLASLLALLVTIPVLAQDSSIPGIPKFQSQVVWDQQGTGCILIGPHGRGVDIFTQDKAHRDFKSPEGQRILTWSEGRFYALRTTPGFEKVSLMASQEGGGFQEVGHFLETTQNLPLDFCVPLRKEGLFLGSCSAFGFVKDEKSSLIGIFRLREDGKLVLEDLPDIHLDHPLFRIGKPKPNETFVTLDPAYSALAPFLEPLIQTEDYLVFVSTRAGILWILDRERGSVRRTVKIYSVEDKDLGVTSDLEPAILGIQPRSDGKVVIAARDEVTFRTARKFFKYQKKEKYSAVWESEKAPDPQAPDDPESRKREAFFALRTFRDILWWELDPATGKLEQIYPEGAPTQLQTPQDLKRFHFHFEPGDKLKTSVDAVPAQVPQSIPQGVAPKDGKERPAAPTPATPGLNKPGSLPVKGKAGAKATA